MNTKDYSYQFAAPKTPVAPRPLLVAVWETRCLETVDIMMELGADTSVLFSSEPDKEKPKPLFFHVRSTSKDFPVLLKSWFYDSLIFSLLIFSVVNFTNLHTEALVSNTVFCYIYYLLNFNENTWTNMCLSEFCIRQNLKKYIIFHLSSSSLD